MENIVIVVHVLVALAIIGLVLLQQGKGAETGASFGGGASQTVFGSQGGGSFFAKVTAVLAVVFFVTSFSLAVIAKKKATLSTDATGIPVVTEQIEPQETDVPVIETDVIEPASDVPSLIPIDSGNSPDCLLYTSDAADD